MPLTAPASHAVRTALGCCLASLFTLVQPLRNLFSAEVAPLLPCAVTAALFVTGGSKEEVMWLSLEAWLATGSAVLNALAVRYLAQGPQVPTESWFAVFVILEGTAFTAFLCLLPVSTTAKTYGNSMSAWFVIALFSPTDLSEVRQSMEYMAVAIFGGLCMIFAHRLRLPGLVDPRCLLLAAADFEIVADGCAEVITEATVALLGSGAGEAWRSIARARLALLSERLAAARTAAAFAQWTPRSALRRLTRVGRAEEEVRTVHREAAFRAASEAIDTCRLLCELAISAHTRGQVSAGAVAVRASMNCLVKVSEQVAAILRDLSRTSVEQMGGYEASAIFDDRRKRLMNATHKAVRNSSFAAQELLLLGLYMNTEDSGISVRELVTARSDMAAFLFLVHALAADLLKAEAATVQAVGRTKIMGAKVWARDEETGELGEPAHPPVPLGLGLLEVPLLLRTPSSHSNTDVVEAVSLDQLHPGPSDANPEIRTKALESIRRAIATPALVIPQAIVGFETLIFSARLSAMDAWRQRWRVALKVSLSFMVGFVGAVYVFELNVQMLCTVTILSNYGSQYDGGSLRRAMQRSVGTAAGATLGSALEQAFVMCFSQAKWLAHLPLGRNGPEVARPDGTALDSMAYQGLALTVSLSLMSGMVVTGLVLMHKGGPHAYTGFVFALFALKSLLCSDVWCASMSDAIKFNMYACLVVVSIEMGVLPVCAGDLLRARLAGACTGAATVLSALISTGVEADDANNSSALEPELSKSTSALRQFQADEDPTPALKMLQKAGSYNYLHPQRVEIEMEPTTELPDLTDRLRAMGMYDKYRDWRGSYLKWRTGSGHGAKGELNSETARAAPGAIGGSTGATASDANPAAPADGAAPTGLTRRASPAERGEQFKVQQRELATFTGSKFAADLPVAARDSIMEPIAAVALPAAPVCEGDIRGVPEIVEREKSCGELNKTLLLEEDAAFTQAQATINEAMMESAREQEMDDRVLADAAKRLTSDLPGLADLLQQQHALTKQQAVPHSSDANSAEPAQSVDEDRQSSGGEGLMVAKATVTPTTRVSFADVQALLDLINDAVVSADDLAAQAAEGLDSGRTDPHDWCQLAGVLGMMRLRLSLLSRIAHRLRHGLSMADLMGGELLAAKRLMRAFGATLAAATCTVAGAPAPPPRTCADLEAKLHSSGEALVSALAMRLPPERQGPRLSPDCKEVAAEILAGTTGHTLCALLGDAAELLALACAVSSTAAGTAGQQPDSNVSSALFGQGVDGRTPVADTADGAGAALAAGADARNAVAAGSGGSMLDLPDLTERLKEAGMYEKYVAWREGYMQWRCGAGKGSKGEIVESSTT